MFILTIHGYLYSSIYVVTENIICSVTSQQRGLRATGPPNIVYNMIIEISFDSQNNVV